jgi:hypothetical protein
MNVIKQKRDPKDIFTKLSHKFGKIMNWKYDPAMPPEKAFANEISSFMVSATASISVFFRSE